MSLVTEKKGEENYHGKRKPLMGHFGRLVGLCQAYYRMFKGDCRNVQNIMGCLREGPEAGKGGIQVIWGGTSTKSGDKRVQLCVSRLLISVLFWLSPVSALQPGLASH